MADTDRSRAQLIEELVELRQQVADSNIARPKRGEEALRKSEERLRAAGKAAYDLIYEWDVASDALEWFGDIDGLLGYRKGEKSRDIKMWLDLIHPEDKVKLGNAVELHRTSTEPIKYEYRVRQKDGTYRHWKDHGLPLFDDKGRPYKWIGVCTDITEHKQAEEKIRESEEKYRVLVENAGEVILVAQDGCLKFVNRRVFDLLGYRPEELEGKPFADYIHPEDRKTVVERFVKRLEGEDLPHVYPFRIIDKTGENRWVEVDAVRIEWEGKPATLNFLADITERKRAEDVTRVNLVLQRLRNEILEMESEESWFNVLDCFHHELNGLIQYHGCGINIVDRENKNFFSYHITPSGPQQGDVTEFLPPALQYAMETQASVYRRNRAEMTAYEDHLGFERNSVVDVPFAAGTIAISSDREDAFSEADIQVMEQFGQVMSEAHRRLVDITERKRLEEEVQKVQNLESLGLLAGGIAHDFNNILTGVTTNLALLQYLLDKGSEEYEITIEAGQAAARIKDLTQQLMTFSKGGAPVKETASLDKLIRETTDLLLHGSNIQPVFHFADDLLSADIDTGQIGQVIQNLVLNADQAMPNGGMLKISAGNVEVEEEDESPLISGWCVKVSVADQGIGIPENILDQVFDPYFSTKATGHGLGLSICYSIIRRHSGHITVSSEVGVGTAFEFYLPASEKEATAVTEQETKLSVGTGRILLMDDEETIHRTVGRTLKLLGYEVGSVYEGDEALRAYKASIEQGSPYDVVIMDLTIPGGMGGKEAVGKLRQIDPQARVIVSSGYANDPVMADYEDYGFAGRVAKPVVIKELADVVKRILAGGD
jgi:PAS domain S-box-containing protein